jgi:hypothetical protein
MKNNKIVTAILMYLLLTMPSFALAQSGWSIDSVMDYGLPESTVQGIIVAILTWLLAIVGIVAVIAFLIAGILYLTSAGDSKQAETAKSAMKYAIYGVLVALSGVVVIMAVDNLLNGLSF